MTTRLNLASNPFRNRVLPWTVTALIAVISIAALLYIVQATMATNSKTQAAQRNVSDLQTETEALNKRRKDVEVALTPDQRRDLKYAHALVDRKKFSWARLLADLEGALPGGIRVTRIAVKEIKVQDDRPIADLDLVVASKTPSTVTEMIQGMESEGVFHAELVSQNPQRGRGEVGSEYELNVHYVPRAGMPVDADAKRPVDTAGQGGKSR